MKQLKFILITLIFLLSACSDSGSDSDEPTKPTEPIPEVTITGDEPVVNSKGGASDLTFTSSSDWTIDVETTARGASWCTVSPTSGKAGNAIVTITTKENESYSDRSAYIKIKTGTKTKNVLVTQKKKDAILVSKEKYEVDPAGGEFSIEVEANIDYQVTIPDWCKDWITPKPNNARSLKKSIETFTVSAGSIEESREGQIIFVNGTLADTVHIYQAIKNSLVLTSNRVNIPEQSQHFDVELLTNVDYQVVIPDTLNWLRLAPTRGLRVDQVSFQAEENTGHDYRAGNIIFINRALNLSDTLRVIQAQKDAIILGATTMYIDGKPTTIEVDLRANIEYDIIIAPDAPWITQSMKRGLSEYRHTFVIAQNNNDYARTGKIFFKDKNSAKKDVLYVEQDIYRDERAILMAIYSALGGDNWTQNTNWGSDKPLNEWYGVRLNYKGEVTSLFMDDNNLVGQIPVEISQLVHLKTLRLSGSKNIQGRIPEEILQMSLLEELDLDRNSLSGAMPTDFTQVPLLERLGLADNNFTGTIPEGIGNLNLLRYLSLDENQLEGSIPASFTNLLNSPNGVIIRIQNNNLSGDIPTSITSHSKWNEFAFQCARQNYPYELNLPPYRIPDIIYTDFSENDLSIREVCRNNKLTILLHWAEWCGPSLGFIEGPLLNLYNGYKNKGFEVVASIANTQELADSKKYIVEKNIPWKNVYKYSGSKYYHGIYGSLIPSYIALDENGTVISNDNDRDKITDLLKERLGEPATSDLYESTDYSKDGEVLTLQKASRGKGVDLVFMGDGFVDRDMNTNGKYEQTMKTAMEHYFSIEPNKSYRNYYNVYAVKAVSKNEVYNETSKTKFEVFFGDGSYVGGNDSMCVAYAQKTPLKNINDSQLTIVINNERYAGTCAMYYSGVAIAYVPLHSTDEEFRRTLLHESAGHGFGKLADEYFYSGSGEIEASEIRQLTDMYEDMGWWSNVSPTNNSIVLRWKHFLWHHDYSYTGMHEGGFLREKGVWRPEENSCMRFNDLYFNAPSREAIVKRIKQIAGETYEYGDFLDNDKYEPEIRYNRRTLNKHEHTPPVVIKGAFRGSPKKSRR